MHYKNIEVEVNLPAVFKSRTTYAIAQEFDYDGISYIIWGYRLTISHKPIKTIHIGVFIVQLLSLRLSKFQRRHIFIIL